MTVSVYDSQRLWSTAVMPDSRDSKTIKAAMKAAFICALTHRHFGRWIVNDYAGNDLLWSA